MEANVPDFTEAVIVDVPSDDAPASAIATPKPYSTSAGPSTVEVYRELWAREASTPSPAAAAEQVAFAKELPQLTREEIQAAAQAETAAAIKREQAAQDAYYRQAIAAERNEKWQAMHDAVTNGIAALDSQIEQATIERDQAHARGDHNNAAYWSGQIGKLESQLADMSSNYDAASEQEIQRSNIPRQATFGEYVDARARGPLEKEWAYKNAAFLQSPGGLQRAEAAVVNAESRGHAPNSPGLINDVNMQLFGAPAYHDGAAPRQSTRITLSAGQLDIAAKTGQTPKEYARNLLKLQDLKRQGMYQDG
jgi:hypothetical protein